MRPKALTGRLAAVVVVASALVSCGGDTPPAVCSDVDALSASFEQLKNVDVSQGGLAKLKDDFDQVRSDLSEVKQSATDEYADKIDAVDQAATSLSTHLSAATSAPSADTIAPLRGDLQALGTSLTALKEDVEGTC